MFLKCETTLNVYQHGDKLVLCRLNAVSSAAGDTPTKSTDATNTCRMLTADQWHCFDKELKSWLDKKSEWADVDVDNELYKFAVKPNVEVKIKRSTLSIKYFHKCLKKSHLDGGDDDDSGGKDSSLPVLDCCLEYKSREKRELPPTPSIPADEYDPYDYDPYASVNKEKSISPLSYEPYTPTKKVPGKITNVDKIKTPGLDFLGFDSNEDTYSPNIERHLAASKITIPVYKPAPIEDKPSPDGYNEVILESDEDVLPTKTHRSIRVRDKHGIHKANSEYIPHSQEMSENVPAYKPTPIEKEEPEGELDEQKKIKTKTKKKAKLEKDVASSKEEKSETDEKAKPRKSNEDDANAEKRTSKDIKKLYQESSEDDLDKASQDKNGKQSTKSKANDQSKETPCTSSEYDFENVVMKHKRERDKSIPRDEKDKKVQQVPQPRNSRKKSETKDCLAKERRTSEDTKASSSLLASIEEESEKNASKQKDRKNMDKEKKRKDKQSSNETETIEEPQNFISEDEFEASSSKQKLKKHEKNTSLEESKDESGDRKKDKRKEKHKSNDKNKTNEEAENKEDHKDRKLSTETSPQLRRSGRSPSKPKRFIEEVGQRYERKTIPKTSPKNKELFGTDDDDDEQDNNNNASCKIPSAFETPKPDKKMKSILLQSSSSSSSAKKKRKRDDCEQEKAGMTKWLGKKKLEPNESPKSSLKSSKKIKSTAKDEKSKRAKSPSPKPMEIVMPTEKELEMMRSKAKQQSEDNEKFKAALERVNVVPKQVEQLSLKDMSFTDLMETFSLYQTDLDQIYEKCRKKDYIKSYDGVNHCLVIGLIDHKIQFKMMEKLSEKYNSNNSTSQATLYANALLPEWILRVFMKRYNLNRSDAIQQIVDQEAYKSYTDAENECSFLDDL
ncbi:enolase-phosphatase E1-like [Musca vetustissima]|uniref:enolase-phosphatase E1-like n=1 Tax=Musca vetustissima TaxID=27455 RepID=UPI002AB5E289|nr:enolase-phosphatase E1-like [Musca vetustissima]